MRAIKTTTSEIFDSTYILVYGYEDARRLIEVGIDIKMSLTIPGIFLEWAVPSCVKYFCPQKIKSSITELPYGKTSVIKVIPINGSGNKVLG